MNLLSLVRNLLPGSPPTNRSHWVGPAFEPANLSSFATIATVQAAIRAAEYGDTTNLFRLYRDSLLGDDHVQGEFNKRKLAVIGQPMSILPADKANPDDLIAAAACARAREDCENWSQALASLLSSSLWPVAVAETIYRPADKTPVTYSPPPNSTTPHAPRTTQFTLQYTLKRIEPVNPMLFCFKHAYEAGFGVQGSKFNVQGSKFDLDSWEPFLKLWPTDSNGQIQNDTDRAISLDPDRHLVHRGHLIADQRDNWGGPFRAITAWWLLRGLGRDWFAGFMERYRWPIPIAKTNIQDREAVELLQNAFATCVRLGGLVIGQDDQVNFEEAQVQGGAEGHKLWHDTCNNAISRHITGYGNSEKPAGINAGEESLTQDIRSDIRILDARLLSETIQKQLFARFLNFNGLSGNVKVSFDPEPAGTNQLKRDVIKAFLADGTVNDMIANLTDLKALVRDVGLPVNEEYTEPYLPVLAQPGEKVTGEVVKDSEGDIVGGATEPPAPGSADIPVRNPDDNPEDDPEDKDDPSGDPDKGEGKRPADTALLSATHHAPRTTPIDHIVTARSAALAAAYKGSMAPFRAAILASSDRADCLKRLHILYADWPASRLAAELDHALQLCAATAAAKESPKS